MLIYVLFAQRKEDYPEQYAPEVLVAWDEFCVDGNLEGWEETKKRAIEACGDQLTATREITLSVSGDKIRAMLVETPSVKAKIVEAEKPEPT